MLVFGIYLFDIPPPSRCDPPANCSFPGRGILLIKASQFVDREAAACRLAYPHLSRPTAVVSGLHFESGNYFRRKQIMAKSKKRLIVRLLIVGTVVGLGTGAIIMSQRGMFKKAQAEQKSDTPKKDGTQPPQPISLLPDDPDNKFEQPPTNAYQPTSYQPPANDNLQSPSQLPPSRYAPDGNVRPAGGTYGELSPPPTGNVGKVPAPPVPGLPAVNNPFPDTNSLPPVGNASVDASLSDDEPNRLTPLPTNNQDFNPSTQPTNNQFAPQELPPANAYQGTGNSDKGYSSRLTDGDNARFDPSNQPNSLPKIESNRRLESRGLAAPQGSGTPGPKTLEGTQSPSLALEKRAPAEIQVGKPAIFQIKVKNIGRTDAEEVTVVDRVPRGTEFVDATPQANRGGDGSLTWQLGTLKPGDEATISLQLLPTTEGEIGSVARVLFQAQASVSTVCTKPLLTIRHSSPPQVLIGESITFDIEISNPGSGAASGVILEEDIPTGLTHPAGSELEFEIGTLRPGESRKLQLTLKADKAGKIKNTLLVRGDGNLIAQDSLDLEVIAPQLEVAMTGPTRRYLDREATYKVSVANPGTAPANDIELVAFLPKGMKYVEATNNGQYDPQNHAVYWSLDELPPTVAGDVELKTLPIEPGQQKLRVEGRAKLGLTAAREQPVLVESLADLYFEVADSADPIEVGSETTYQVRVINRGTKTATNVQIAALVPQGLQAIGGDGPTRSAVNGQEVIFAPLARLAPNGEAVFKIQTRGLRAGDQRIQVQLASDESKEPVIKEESTKVYSDR